MVLSQILAIVRTFLASARNLVITFTGKDTLKEFEDYADQIVGKINEALGVPEYADEAATYEQDYNDFMSELDEAKSDYGSWETATGNYNDTVTVLASYRASLAAAQAAGDQDAISNYETLISRSETTLARREAIVNSRWSDFLSSVGEVVTAFTPLWNGYETLKGYLP